MSSPAPHFLLKAECRLNHPGNWRFILQSADGRRQVEVEDAEPTVHGERLELLTVIRGLEAIDRPAHVTLLTPSAYVRRGIKYGLDDWRANNWQWERHGEMIPVKNGDLWRRLDRALQVHHVECQLVRLEEAVTARADSGMRTADANRQKTVTVSVFQSDSAQPKWRRMAIAYRRLWREMAASLRLRFAQFGTNFLPKPRLE